MTIDIAVSSQLTLGNSRQQRQHQKPQSLQQQLDSALAAQRREITHALGEATVHLVQRDHNIPVDTGRLIRSYRYRALPESRDSIAQIEVLNIARNAQGLSYAPFWRQNTIRAIRNAERTIGQRLNAAIQSALD